MKSVIKLVKSKKGFTLTEMLVTVAVLGLLSVAIATAMAGTIPTYQKSVAQSESSVLISTLTKSINDELRYAQNIKVDSSGNLDTYKSSTYGSNSKFQVIDGKIFITSTTPPKDYPILGSGSYTNLTTNLEITYDEPTKIFTVTLTILDQTGTNQVNQGIFQISTIN